MSQNTTMRLKKVLYYNCTLLKWNFLFNVDYQRLTKYFKASTCCPTVCRHICDRLSDLRALAVLDALYLHPRLHRLHDGLGELPPPFPPLVEREVGLVAHVSSQCVFYRMLTSKPYKMIKSVGVQISRQKMKPKKIKWL